MNNCREICTLQFGHYSNFVGTHWWNIQEQSFSFSPDEKVEINNKILYREGQTLRGDPTYTPRLLLVDLKGSLGALPVEGELYNPKSITEKINVPWHEDKIDVRKEKQVSKNEYLADLDDSETATNVHSKNYDFESTVNVWSDFLYARFHPRTVKVINDYQHNNDRSELNVFPLGRNLWKSKQFTEDFCDDLQYFVEECDNIQGFQIMVDATNGFSGLSSSCLEYLEDEYDRKSILAIPVLPSHYNDYDYECEEDQRKSQIADSLRVINLAMCFHDLSEHSSMFIPLSTTENGWRNPLVKRYRLKKEFYNLNDLSYDFCQHGRKLVAASLCLPFAMEPSGNLLDCLDRWEGQLTQSLTPNCTLGSDRTLNMLAIRGLPINRLKKSLQNAGEQRNMPAYRCDSIEEMFKFYLSCTSIGSASQVVATEKPLDVKTPLPNIFDEKVNVDGMLERRNPNDKVKSVSVLAGLHSGSEIGSMIDSLLQEVKKVNIRRYHQFSEAGLESDEFKECLTKLMDFKDCYEDNYLI